MKRLLLFILLSGVGWWVYKTQYYKRFTDLSSDSGKLEKLVNQRLSSAGIDDAAVTYQTNSEHHEWGFSWVEMERHFQVAKPANQYVSLLNKLAEDVQQYGCRAVRRDETPTRTIFEIAKYHFVLQRIWFITIPANQRINKKVHLEGKPVFKKASLAIVIDDVGYAEAPFVHFKDLQIPLTFAVLPGVPHSRDLAEKVYGSGNTVILHMPMEPLPETHAHPESSALTVLMSEVELSKHLSWALSMVPHARGLNNHMGSAFTSDQEKMDQLMPFVKAQDLFFLDSHTAKTSVVCKAAKKYTVPCLENDTFLDNQDTVEAITSQLKKAAQKAFYKGQSVAIGHFRRKQLIPVLTKMIPELKEQGIDFVPLTDLYRTPT